VALEEPYKYNKKILRDKNETKIRAKQNKTFSPIAI
jgi:hypothetical protein